MEKKVKQLYTEYIYPTYDKKIDKYSPAPQKFSPSLFLEQINHYIYKGRKKHFNNYNVLVAGVGLGSDIIQMGFFLKKYNNIKLVGIDLSPASLEICKKRLYKYNLETNIKLIEMSLLDLDPKVHGKFDCIICQGVLHHLEDPQKGLDSLNNVLKDDGFMNIMVYGKYGRTGVYQMQDLMKRVNYNVNDFPSKIKNFKTIYKQLSEDNWFKKGENITTDHKVSDGGIVDMILHYQDRSYSISELYAWINISGLDIVEFSPENRYQYKYKISDIDYPNNIVEKYSINELFFGNINKHNFYISKNINTKATIDDLDNILILVLLKKENMNVILEQYKKIENCNSIDIQTNLNYKINDKLIWSAYSYNFINLNIEINDIIYTILNNIDNNKTIKEIFDIVRKELNITNTNDNLLAIFKPIYYKFELYDLILLRK